MLDIKIKHVFAFVDIYVIFISRILILRSNQNLTLVSMHWCAVVCGSVWGSASPTGECF